MSAGLISAMAEPLVALVHSLGSGALPQNFGAALRSSATAIDAAHEQHRAGIGVLEAAWRGPAAQSAQQTAAAVQTAAASISDRGEELATVVDRAAADVAAGVRKLEDILRAFLDKADRLVPFLLTPMGLIGLVGLAQEHLQQALVVVGEIRAKLDAHTAAVTKLMPPPNQVPGPVTAPLDTAAVSSVVAAGANPAVTAVDLLKTPGSTVQEAAASFNAASFSPKAARGGAGTPGYDGAQ
ncbi:MAG: hydrolase, partial [Streptomycetaceae bacterium]|nr:hydrolase [Streptomycetaceae bacterium]